MRPSQWQFEARISTNASFSCHKEFDFKPMQYPWPLVYPCRAPDMTFGLTLSPSLRWQALCLKVTCFYSWPCSLILLQLQLLVIFLDFQRARQPEIIIYEFALLSPFLKVI